VLQKNTINKLFKIITPCTICLAICIVQLILTTLKAKNGWESLIYVGILIIMLVLSLLTIVSHLLFKNNILYLWLFEIVGIIAIALIF
jgi:hypothetical protein